MGGGGWGWWGVVLEWCRDGERRVVFSVVARRGKKGGFGTELDDKTIDEVAHFSEH